MLDPKPQVFLCGLAWLAVSVLPVMVLSSCPLPPPRPGPDLVAGPCSGPSPCPSASSNASSAPPSPSSSPSPGPGCPLRVLDVEWWRVAIAPLGGQRLDLTVFACGPMVVGMLQGCGTKCCELSPDRGAVNTACVTELYGAPAWVGQGVTVVPTGNPFTVKIAEGRGLLSVSPTAPGAAAIPGSGAVIHAQAAAPACDLGEDGACR